MHAYRTHSCGALRLADVGSEVRLSGWIHRKRDHGGLLFVDLRDHYGLTQLVAHPGEAGFETLDRLRAESVVRVDGEVVAREASTVNPNLATGEVEVRVRAAQALAHDMPQPVGSPGQGVSSSLAPIAWRLQGHRGGYYGDVDEQFYASLVRRSAHVPLTTTDPFDVEWRHASSPYGVLLPQLLALPDRAGAPPGAWSDLSRWLGSGAAAWLLIRAGSAVASPAVGAAAATLVLLDPGSYYGKPLLRLATGRWEPASEPQQLPMSRLFTPSYLLPFYAAALLLLVRAVGGGPRRRRPGSWAAVATFAGLGIAGYFFFWSAAVAGAVAIAVVHPRRRAVWRWIVPAVLAAACG